MDRKSKIVATMGPSSTDEAVLEKLILAGMDVARLNFSHGTYESHAARATTLRSIARRLNCPLAILQDLQGPKIRVGNLPGPITLLAGQLVHLYPEGGTQPENLSTAISVDFPQLFDSVKTSDRILLDDGRLALRVRSVQENLVIAEVVVGGELTSHKGINLPGIRLNIPAFSEKDSEDLEFGLSLGI